MRPAVFMLILLCAGCWNTRASVGVIAPTSKAGVELIGDHAVIGHACGFGQRERRAFDDALAKQPGAEALARVDLADHGNCALVLARPARFSPGATLSPPALSSERSHEDRQPEPGTSLVYFYRFDIGRSRREVTLALDGGPTVRLDNEGATALTIKPGTYSGKATRAGDTVPIAKLELAADRVYYIRVANTGAFQPSAMFGVIGSRSRSSFMVELREPAFGAAELKWLAERADK
jgi:hypothetical protein